MPSSSSSENKIKLDSKQLLSASVVKKKFSINPEKILYEHLYPKFGERYTRYREKYENYLKDQKHNYLPEFPISVILELINRCNLECPMCYQGFRNDTKKNTLEIKNLEKLFNEFKINKLDALLFSTSEPLLYKNFFKVLDMAAKSGIMDLFLFTNGELLNEKNSQFILNSTLTRLFITLE